MKKKINFNDLFLFDSFDNTNIILNENKIINNKSNKYLLYFIFTIFFILYFIFIIFNIFCLYTYWNNIKSNHNLQNYLLLSLVLFPFLKIFDKSNISFFFDFILRFIMGGLIMINYNHYYNISKKYNCLLLFYQFIYCYCLLIITPFIYFIYHKNKFILNNNIVSTNNNLEHI